MPILAEDRINMRIELQYADKDESWIRDEEKLLLNTFASMLQERFEDFTQDSRGGSNSFLFKY